MCPEDFLLQGEWSIITTAPMFFLVNNWVHWACWGRFISGKHEFPLRASFGSRAPQWLCWTYFSLLCSLRHFHPTLTPSLLPSCTLAQTCISVDGYSGFFPISNHKIISPNTIFAYLILLLHLPFRGPNTLGPVLCMIGSTDQISGFTAGVEKSSLYSNHSNYWTWKESSIDAKVRGNFG